jgi:hypothetical protein
MLVGTIASDSLPKESSQQDSLSPRVFPSLFIQLDKQLLSLYLENRVNAES